MQGRARQTDTDSGKGLKAKLRGAVVTLGNGVTGLPSDTDQGVTFYRTAVNNHIQLPSGRAVPQQQPSSLPPVLTPYQSVSRYFWFDLTQPVIALMGFLSNSHKALFSEPAPSLQVPASVHKSNDAVLSVPLLYF